MEAVSNVVWGEVCSHLPDCYVKLFSLIAFDDGLILNNRIHIILFIINKYFVVIYPYLKIRLGIKFGTSVF